MNKMSRNKHKWEGSIRESQKNKRAFSTIAGYLQNQESIYCPNGIYQLEKGFAHNDVKGPISSSIEGLLAMAEAGKPTFMRLTNNNFSEADFNSIEKIVDTNIKDPSQVSIELGGFRHQHLERVNPSTGDVVISAEVIPNYLDKEQPYRLLAPKVSILVDRHETNAIDLENNCCIASDEDFNIEKGYPRTSSGHILVKEGLVECWVGNANYYKNGKFPVVLAPGKSINNYSDYFLVHEGMSGFRGSFKDIRNMLEKTEEIAKYLESPDYKSKKMEFDIARLNEISGTYRILFDKERETSERYDIELSKVRESPEEHLQKAKKMHSLRKKDRWETESSNYFSTFDIRFPDEVKGGNE